MIPETDREIRVQVAKDMAAGIAAIILICFICHCSYTTIEGIIK